MLLKQLNRRLISLASKDEVEQSQTDGLVALIRLKVNASVIITANIGIANRLLNGKIATVKHMKIKQNEATAIYLALDDDTVG